MRTRRMKYVVDISECVVDNSELEVKKHRNYQKRKAEIKPNNIIAEIKPLEPEPEPVQVEVVNIPAPVPTTCGECGRPLDIVKWNSRGSQCVCDNWKCGRYRQPQGWIKNPEVAFA